MDSEVLFSQGEAKRPLIASAVRAEKLTIDGKPFDVRKGELFIVVEMGERWKVKPMERRWNDVYLPLDLLQVSLSYFCSCVPCSVLISPSFW